MDPPKNPMGFIRTYVFAVSQRTFADLLGVTQPAVSKWEVKGSCEYETMCSIRDIASRLKLDWDDSFFFEIPKNWRAWNGKKRN